MASDSTLLEERHGRVALFRLNRPDRKNSLDPALIAALDGALRRVTASDEVRAVVLTGKGGAFCSGADLKEALESRESGAPLGERIAAFQRLIPLITEARQPVIAAVDGAAVGFGADLALACDLRIFSERAYLQEKFVTIGLMPDGGGSYHLPRLVGLGRALELLLLGEPVDAERSLTLGLATRVVPAEALLTEALALAGRLAQGPPLALARIKAAARAGLTDTLSETLERERAGQAELLESADFAEGVAAWSQKRKAEFRGR